MPKLAVYSDNGQKLCTTCLEFKDSTEFKKRKDRSTGSYNFCVSCAKAKQRQYYKSVDIVHWRANNLMTRFKLKYDDFERLKVAQNNRCAICNLEFNDDTRANRPQVDHDHKSGIVRGLLCFNCNTAIGLMSDDSTRLINAAEYLNAASN